MIVRAVYLASFMAAIGIVALPFALFQDFRLVPKEDMKVFDGVESAKAVLSKFNPRRMDPSVETKVSVSVDELEAALGAVSVRTLPGSSVDIQPGEGRVRVVGTIELPAALSITGKYLNVEVVLADSEAGVEFSKVSVGSIPVPVWLVKPVSVFLVDWIVGEGKGKLAYESVRSVRLDGSKLSVTFKPPAGLYEDFKSAAGRLVHRGNLEAIQAYYNEIVKVSQGHRGQKSVALSAYLAKCAQLAAMRSVTHSATEENRAFILALGLYFGDSRFSMLLGEVVAAAATDQGFKRDIVKLSGRHDWVQHFVTSAALQVAAGSDISNFIGESKEIVDAEGPSGFSFTDIAADRAGVRFARVATRSASDARALQALLAESRTELDVFPMVTDLPEGLSEKTFKLKFRDVGSFEYNALIAVIDRRISALKAHEN